MISIATLPWIALLALSVSIELVSSSARVTSVKFQQGVVLTHSLTDIRTQRSDQGHLGPIKITHALNGQLHNYDFLEIILVLKKVLLDHPCYSFSLPKIGPYKQKDGN